MFDGIIGWSPPPPSTPPGGADDHPEWLEQWIAACDANLDDPLIRALARETIAKPFDAVVDKVRAEAAALAVRRLLPYRFTGRDRIVSLREARARGFGACGDGSAAVAAVALLSSSSSVVHLCYELSPSRRSYAHVAVDVDGFRADPYPDASLSVTRCAVVDDVRELVKRWRVVAKK